MSILAWKPISGLFRIRDTKNSIYGTCIVSLITYHHRNCARRLRRESRSLFSVVSEAIIVGELRRSRPICLR